MADFDVASTMMDYHAEVGCDKFAEFGVEYFRITQALQEAWIDIHMLNSMDRARISAALWKDNSLFEEGGSLIAMFRQTHGLLDSMHIEEDELDKLESGWHQLTEEQQKLIDEDWKNRSKNLATLNAELEDLRIRGSLSERDSAVSHFEAMTPLQLGRVNPQYHMARAHLIEEQKNVSLQSRVLEGLEGFDTSILSGIRGVDVGPAAVASISTSFSGKPAGFGSWVEKVQAEKAAPTVQQEVPEALDKMPQTHVEQLERERLLDELRPDELQAN